MMSLDIDDASNLKICVWRMDGQIREEAEYLSRLDSATSVMRDRYGPVRHCLRDETKEVRPDARPQA